MPKNRSSPWFMVSCGAKYQSRLETSIHSDVLTQTTNATDKHTDGHTDSLKNCRALRFTTALRVQGHGCVATVTARRLKENSYHTAPHRILHQ